MCRCCCKHTNYWERTGNCSRVSCSNQQLVRVVVELKPAYVPQVYSRQLSCEQKRSLGYFLRCE